MYVLILNNNLIFNSTPHMAYTYVMKYVDFLILKIETPYTCRIVECRFTVCAIGSKFRPQKHMLACMRALNAESPSVSASPHTAVEELHRSADVFTLV